jgi:hypothetical protein
MVDNKGASAPAGKPKRKLRNYLIDRRFQMKYALLLSGASAALMGAMGVVLYLQMRDAERRLTDESVRAHEGIGTETVEASRALRSEMDAAAKMLREEMDISARQLVIRQIPCVAPPSCPPCTQGSAVTSGGDGDVATQATGAVCDVQTCRPLCEALGLQPSPAPVAPSPVPGESAAEEPAAGPQPEAAVETPGLAALPDPEAAEAERRRQEELIRKIEETVRAETETRAQEMADQTRTRLQALESATRGRLGALDAETQRRLENLRAANRQEMQAVLISLVVLFVILVLLGIVVTHRVAGPIYKMKLLMAKIDGDHLRLDGQLRRGDELRDLFEELSGMLERLRNHQRSEITDLDALLERLRTAKDDDERTSALSALEAFRERMEGALAGKA